MKILAVSDVVKPILFQNSDDSPLADVDLILSCGDLPPEYLSRLVNSFRAPLYYVRGNHDIRYDQKPPQGCRDLHRMLIKIRGINILGLEGSLWYNGGPHQYEERQMRSIIRRLRPTLWWRGGVDVVMTHAPPRHIHDAEDPCHRGFECFRRLIEKYCPSYFIHGHIHREFSDPSERITVIDSTQVVNTYGYCLLEIESRPRMRNSRLSSNKQAEPPPAIKSFTDQQKKEAAFDARDRGIRTVPMDRIVGSVGRYQDFDSRFRFKHNMPSERLQWITDAIRQGRSLGPVKLYQIKDDYYILDGNHRISAAKQLNHDEILAHIFEFIPSENTLQNILYRERAEFSDRTQLPDEINLTEVSQYAHLLDQITDHRENIQAEQGSTISFENAALDWHKTVYRPLRTIIKRARLIESFPGRTIADLYAYITLHHWKEGRKRHYGIGIDKLITKNMEDFRKKMAVLKDAEYPEMKRGITVFILMNVQAKKEFKLIEKLYELEEVREIHSVHGDVDLLVKVVLTRDLLSSDAEIISQFVHEKVRQLPGVNSTNTLIPGLSRIKGSEAP